MNLPIEVIEAVNEARCVLFVGSRFSAEAAEAAGREYPDGEKLAKSLGWTKTERLMGMRRSRKRITPSVAQAGQSVEDDQGRSSLVTRLKMQLSLADIPPTEAHEIALRHFSMVFTTNYDDLLERVDDGRAIFHRPDEIPQRDAWTQPMIYKFRGGFSATESMVVTRADYERVAFADSDKRRIRELMRKNVVLFVGYKPDEEEFQILWEDLTDAFGGELPRCHLAVAQGRIDDYLWQKWVWRGLLMFTADPTECLRELETQMTQMEGGDQ